MAHRMAADSTLGRIYGRCRFSGRAVADELRRCDGDDVGVRRGVRVRGYESELCVVWCVFVLCEWCMCCLLFVVCCCCECCSECCCVFCVYFVCGVFVLISTSVCPSGLRGYVQVVMFSNAWVQIPQLTYIVAPRASVLTGGAFYSSLFYSSFFFLSPPSFPPFIRLQTTSCMDPSTRGFVGDHGRRTDGQKC
jgi:hypothetical protein